MAAAPQYLSLEEFERLYARRKPHYEYWFGEAIQKQMPTFLHGTLQWVLAMLLARRGWKTSSEVRLKISKMAEPVPDVVANRTLVGKDYPREAIDLCVEILSPGDRLLQAFAKAAHYLDWKIGTVWIIDPEGRRAYSMSLEDPIPVEVGMAGSLFAGSGDDVIEIPMHELFEEVDKNFQNQKA